jgi:predicted dinucleotide-binding enzyme
MERAASGDQHRNPAGGGGIRRIDRARGEGGGGRGGAATGGASSLAGKPVIDTTNPVTDAPPVNGVLSFYTSMNESGLELLQRQFPALRFVKAFNSVGAEFMVDPRFEGGPPTMFICGNDAAAKQTVTDILQQFGWEVADMGAAQGARAIEPLCLLWCIPGFLRNEWSHAFKLLRS